MPEFHFSSHAPLPVGADASVARWLSYRAEHELHVRVLRRLLHDAMADGDPGWAEFYRGTLAEAEHVRRVLKRRIGAAQRSNRAHVGALLRFTFAAIDRYRASGPKMVARSVLPGPGRLRPHTRRRIRAFRVRAARSSTSNEDASDHTGDALALSRSYCTNAAGVARD